MAQICNRLNVYFKHSIYSLMFVFIFFSCEGQNISLESRNFILDFYKKETKSANSFIYSKGIDSYWLDELKKTICNTDTLRKYLTIDNKRKITDSLILTKNEKKFILDQLEFQTDTSQWNNLNINNSLAINQDTIKAIFKNKKKMWSYFYAKYKTDLKSFSIPIIIRNNSLCIFYNDVNCGDLCGEGKFAIYRKENDKWIVWFVLFEWIS
jgi:hypothetical protein